MVKNNQQNPHLRFKQDSGDPYPDWQTHPLGYFLSIPKKEKINQSNIDKNKLITVRLNLQGVLLNTKTENLSLGSSYYIRKKGQFIYGKQNFFNGAFGIIPDSLDGFLSSSDIPSFEIDNSKVSSSYLMMYLGRKSLYSYYENIASGTGSKRIHEKDLLLKVLIPLPSSIEEQTKIGNFLKSVDDKISLQNKSIEKLKRYKTSLMQQLFPQNNQQNPHLRFKQDSGDPYPDWQTQKLGDISDFLKGTGLSKSILYLNGKNKCILYGEIFTTYNNYISDTISRTDENIGTKSKINDIIMPSSTTTTAIDLIKAVLLQEENVLLGGDIIIIRNKFNLYNSLFLMYFLNYNRVELSKKAQGITIIHLYPKQLQDSIIPLPSSIEEQTKIGNFLKSVDDKITLQNKKLEKLKRYKTSLMQQLFPST